MKLIKLQDKFILVNSKAEEGINPQTTYFDDKIDSDNIYVGTEMFTENKIYKYIKGININNRTVHEIIAGITEKPTCTCSETEANYCNNGGPGKCNYPYPRVDFSLLKEEDCLEIGYVDVEKLAVEETIRNEYNSEISFKQGFRRAQSLNDKMFSLEDMKEYLKLYRIHIEVGFKSKHKWVQTPSEFIQSLQQTSWDVEVNEFNQITKIL